MRRLNLPLWIASASLSGISMLNSYTVVNGCHNTSFVPQPTSSIAMTTSTVSKLSRPRSFVKCDDGESYSRCQAKNQFERIGTGVPSMRPEPVTGISSVPCPAHALHTLSKFLSRSRMRPVTSSLPSPEDEAYDRIAEMDVAGVDILDWAKGARKAVWTAGLCTRVLAWAAHLMERRRTVRYIVTVVSSRWGVRQWCRS